MRCHSEVEQKKCSILFMVGVQGDLYSNASGLMGGLIFFGRKRQDFLSGSFPTLNL